MCVVHSERLDRQVVHPNVLNLWYLLAYVPNRCVGSYGKVTVQVKVRAMVRARVRAQVGVTVRGRVN